MHLGQRTKSLDPLIPESPTARRILEHAREAFNERGAFAVGVREIARDLELSPGNLSYYFPTKEALVTALVREGHAANNALVKAPARLRSFDDLFEMIRTIMRRDLENRWLLRDYVGLLVAMPALCALHEQMQPAREARVDAMLTSLVEAGLLDGERVNRRRPLLRQQLFTQVFFWLPAALLSASARDPAMSLDLHARATLALLQAYCTAVGRRQLEALLDRPGA
ncbi:MAG TPA: TetR/AcrR family transcriptional regulator [Polyangiaceae bacterium]